MRISSDSVLPCCDTFQKKNFPMAQYHGMIFCCQGYLNIMFFTFFEFSLFSVAPVILSPDSEVYSGR